MGQLDLYKQGCIITNKFNFFIPSLLFKELIDFYFSVN